MNRDNTITFLLVVWAVLFMHTARAATLGEFVIGYDLESLKWAGTIALLGGSLRTIFSLQSDGRAIRAIAPEALWDALKALVAGLAAFVALEAVHSATWKVPSEVKFGAILAAGTARLAAVDWMRNAGMAWLDARKKQIVNEPKDTQ